MISTQTSLLFALSLCVLVHGVQAGWKAINHSSNRRLETDDDDEYEYAFIHSVIDGNEWCITASDGVVYGAIVRSEPCGFAIAPASQLWHFTNDGKIKSKGDPTLCVTIGQGIFQDGSSRARLKFCDAQTKLNLFDHAIGSYDHIVLQADDSYCLTSQGTTPRARDAIIARGCGNTERFSFYYFVPYDYTGTFGLCNDDAYPEGGCLTVRNENPQEGELLILGNWNLNHEWRYDSDGLFHTVLDDDMCMQAGHQPPAKSGRNMRLYPCDKTNPLQKFFYDGVDIKLQGSDYRCVGFRGRNSNVDKDPLVLKDCVKWGNNWSED